MEKFGAYTRAVLAAATALRTCGSWSYQPVVPQTVFTPNVARRRRFSGAAAGAVNSMAIAAPFNDSRESAAMLATSKRARTSKPCSGASCSTRLPILPVPMIASGVLMGCGSGGQKLTNHARVNLHGGGQLRFGDALLGGVRYMNAARTDEKRLAPGAVE